MAKYSSRRCDNTHRAWGLAAEWGVVSIVPHGKLLMATASYHCSPTLVAPLLRPRPPSAWAMKRPGEKGARSTQRARPVQSSSAMDFPETGAQRIPCMQGGGGTGVVTASCRRDHTSPSVNSPLSPAHHCDRLALVRARVWQACACTHVDRREGGGVPIQRCPPSSCGPPRRKRPGGGGPCP